MTLINQIRFAPAVAALALLLTAAEPNSVAFAQTPAISAALPESTIKSLQEALNKQGIETKTDGVLTDETRAAIRKLQSQHHLPVTGEPDKPTLEKLGVAARQSAAPGGQSEQVQTGTRPNMAAGGMMQGGMMQGGMMRGGMMNCPMMRPGQAAGQSGVMQGNMQMQPGQIAQGGATEREMMQGMMQVMQGMMQMMYVKLQRHGSSQSTPTQPEAMPHGQTQQNPR